MTKFRAGALDRCDIIKANLVKVAGVKRVGQSGLVPYGDGLLLPTASEAAGSAYALGAVAHTLAQGGEGLATLQQALDHLRTGLDLAAAGLVLGEGEPTGTLMSHRPGVAGLATLAATGRELAAAGLTAPVLSQAAGSGWAALPVRARGRGYGALWAARPEGALTAMHTAALGAAAAQIGIFLALRQAERRLAWDEASAGEAWALQARRGGRPQLPPLPEPLSGREVNVLRSLAAGRRNKQIARELHISENTVKFHIQNIYQKLGVGNRTQASSAAMERGLLD